MYLFDITATHIDDIALLLKVIVLVLSLSFAIHSILRSLFIRIRKNTLQNDAPDTFSDAMDVDESPVVNNEPSSLVRRRPIVPPRLPYRLDTEEYRNPLDPNIELQLCSHFKRELVLGFRSNAMQYGIKELARDFRCFCLKKET